jgi:ribulose-5-phosphate 4-epimerase/fuculose-1-phosphate aldolase
MVRLPRRRALAILGGAASASLVRNLTGVAQQQTPSSATQVDPTVIEDLVAANHVLAHEGVLDGYGHVSVRRQGAADRFLLARSIAPELVTPADILEYDLDGNPANARGATSYRERFIHSEIYKVRRDVNAIVHCHTPSLIPFGVSSVPLRPIYHQSAFVAQGVPVFEIRDVAGMSDMLIKDARLGQALARTLADKPAALMRGHGAVVVGGTISTVVGRSIYLDLNARLQAQAMALGGKVTYLEPEEARLYVASDNYERAWELWKRKVSK